MSQQEINPLEDWASEELSEAELDALAGGFDLSALGTDASLFTSDTAIIKKSDNMFSSYDGAKGTTLDNDYSFAKPLNTSMLFP